MQMDMSPARFLQMLFSLCTKGVKWKKIYEIIYCIMPNLLVSSYDSIATDQIIKEVRKGPYLAEITIDEGNQKTYILRSNAKLRDNLPVEKKTDITIDHSGSFTDTRIRYLMGYMQWL